MDQEQIPSKDQLRDWFDHPVSIYYFQTLREEREQELQRLANGVYSEDQGKQNIAIGFIAALTKQLNAEILEDIDG